MYKDKAYCDNHEYEWAPYSLAYINYWLVDENDEVVYELVYDADGNVVLESNGDPKKKLDG